MSQTEDKILTEIAKTEKDTLEGLKELHQLKREEDRRVAAAREYEKHKWQRFREIIKGQEYFRFAHVEKLGIKASILIHLSAKNGGKTTEIYREMKRIIAKGEKFLYGRVYVAEMLSAIHQFEVDEESPCVILQKQGRFYFYLKSDIEFWRTQKLLSMGEDENTLLGYPRIVDLEKLGIKPVGLGYSFVNSNTLGGMNYEGFSTIFFDEILSYSPINRINKRVLDAWDASISTITRKKPDIRVYFLGNLLDVPEHPILDFYGVSVDDDLRIVTRGEKGECTILFINSGGLYEATFRNQAGVTKHGAIEHQAFLKNNKVLKSTPNILTWQIFQDMKPEMSFALSMHPEVFFLELRSHDANPEDRESIPVYCASCQILKITSTSGSDIFSDDPTIYNKFENVSPRTSIQAMFNHVFRLFRSKALKFDSGASLEKYSLLLKQYQQTYLYDYAE